MSKNMDKNNKWKSENGNENWKCQIMFVMERTQFQMGHRHSLIHASSIEEKENVTSFLLVHLL